MPDKPDLNAAIASVIRLVEDTIRHAEGPVVSRLRTIRDRLRAIETAMMDAPGKG